MLLHGAIIALLFLISQEIQIVSSLLQINWLKAVIDLVFEVLGVLVNVHDEIACDFDVFATFKQPFLYFF